MRLWHKDLISALPRSQLVSQWRECCAIAKNLAQKGTPNHGLVNKILDYPIDEFLSYTTMVVHELQRRKYKIAPVAWNNFFSNIVNFARRSTFRDYAKCDIFKDWHNSVYLGICYSNLYEKHICGMISKEEFMPISDIFVKHILKK